MKITLDFGKLQKRIESLPDEVKPGEADEAVAELYTEQDGKLVIDREARTRLAAHYAGEAERDRLRQENADMKDRADRAEALRTVREAMAAAGVRPKMLDAAATLFCAQHKFGRAPNGSLRIIGKIGKSDVEAAMIAWVAGEDGEAFTEHQHSGSDDGGFTAQIRKLRGSLH